MKGAIALCLKELVIDKFGQEKWLESLKNAEIEKEPVITMMSDLEDDLLMKLIDSVCKTVRIPQNLVIDSFGEYWVTAFAARIYSAHYQGMSNSKDFILKLDSIHDHVSKHMANAAPPRFTYQKVKGNKYIINYNSARKLIDIYIALAKGVGVYFGENLNIVKLNDSQVEITFP
jgi:methyl-accepting chemotaxis protein